MPKIVTVFLNKCLKLEFSYNTTTTILHFDAVNMKATIQTTVTCNLNGKFNCVNEKMRKIEEIEKKNRENYLGYKWSIRDS